MANPRIDHLFVRRVVRSPHFENNLLDELEHPLHEPVGLAVDRVGQPYVLLLVAGHHDHYFLFHHFPHPPPQLHDNGLQFGLIAELAHPHVLMLYLQFVAVVHENSLTIMQIYLPLGYLQRLIFYH